MDESQLEALLGRNLTDREVENLYLYLDIAQDSLENLLCMSLDVQSGSGELEHESRVFVAREGYSTLFTGIFTEIDSVTVDGIATTEYVKVFWDNRNSDYYNSIVFNEPLSKESEVVVTAAWGLQELPVDIQLLLAQLFANTSKKYISGGIKSKRVEDFNITFSDLTDEQEFLNRNASIIRKYSLCNVGYVKNGEVC